RCVPFRLAAVMHHPGLFRAGCLLLIVQVLGLAGAFFPDTLKSGAWRRFWARTRPRRICRKRYPFIPAGPTRNKTVDEGVISFEKWNEDYNPLDGFMYEAGWVFIWQAVKGRVGLLAQLQPRHPAGQVREVDAGIVQGLNHLEGFANPGFPVAEEAGAVPAGH